MGNQLKKLDRQLIEASKDGNLSQVKSLIIEGADIHADGDCALHLAAEFGQLEMVKYLVEDHDANVNTWDDYSIRWAALKGQLEVVKYLVSKGANIHAQNDCALRWAAENGHLEVVKYLKTYSVLQFTKKHIDKQNLRYVFQQYELPFDIQQLISSYVY